MTAWLPRACLPPDSNQECRHFVVFFFILFDFLFFNEFFFVPSLFVGNECTDYIDFPKKKSSGLKIAFFFCFYFPADRF